MSAAPVAGGWGLGWLRVQGPEPPPSPAVKPDPPINVTVEALEKAPQRLRVNWSYPSSWDPRFYWLRFQVRYRPEPAPTFMEVRPPLAGMELLLVPGQTVPSPVSPPGGSGDNNMA